MSRQKTGEEKERITSSLALQGTQTAIPTADALVTAPRTAILSTAATPAWSWKAEMRSV